MPSKLCELFIFAAHTWQDPCESVYANLTNRRVNLTAESVHQVPLLHLMNKLPGKRSGNIAETSVEAEVQQRKSEVLKQANFNIQWILHQANAKSKASDKTLQKTIANYLEIPKVRRAYH